MHLFRKWWMSWQWVVIPATVLIAVELWVKHNFDEIPVWYAAADRVAAAHRIDVVFIGSSRVREGVYVPVFENEVFKVAGQCARAVNLGLGYSTPAEHYFGLRNLFTSHPSNLKGVTLFIEAAGGLPSVDRWEDPWIHTSQPQLIADLLRPQDMPRFWMSQGQTADEKIQLTVRASLGEVSAFNRRERVRASLQDGGGLGLILSAFSNRPVVEAADQRNSRLMGSGGTRADPQSVSLARRLAIDIGQQTPQQEWHPVDWSTTIVSDIVDLVHKNGGQIVFFDVPLSTPFKRAFATPNRLQDSQMFRNQAASWKAQFLAPQIYYTDDDLPDLWHAGHDLAERFSVALGDAWATETTVNREPGTASTACTGR